MKAKMLAVIFGALALTACSKLTKENYDKLEMGMSLKEVSAVLGSADDCGKTMGTEACVWGDEEAKHIKIVFMADKAVTFSYEGLE